MDRKKRTVSKKTRRRPAKRTIKTNKERVILLGLIIGISIALFFIRHAVLSNQASFVTATPQPIAQATATPWSYELPLTVIEPKPTSTPSAKQTPKPAPKPTVKPTATPFERPMETQSPVPKPTSTPVTASFIRPSKGILVFVFDDAGYNLGQLEAFTSLPFPCTIAVLPGLQYSKIAAERIRDAGKELILHQPMQAINLSSNPGPGAILPGMSTDEVRSIIHRNLDEVWPVVGLNNHEGSLITADRVYMETILDVVSQRGIFFLDSRTNAKTVAPIVAKERNMKIWERAVFLDNSQDRDAIIEAVETGFAVAERKGAAIMIGHIWSNQLASILTEMYPEMVKMGFSLSTIAQLATNPEFEE